MKARIVKELNRIENEHDVRIIYACESGSRAWGFPSKNSDYDVRFFYVHPLEWYISITEKRDVIELPICDTLDINGWDIQKAFKLLRKSNNPLNEWLSSPIVYKKSSKSLKPLLDLAAKAFLPETSCHHYLAMAQTAFKKITTGHSTRLKAYMYAIRTLLCCRWIIKYKSHPPMLIHDLIENVLREQGIRKTLEKAIKIKLDAEEDFIIERNTILDKFILHQIDSIQKQIPKNGEKERIESFDIALRKVIHSVHDSWQR